MCNCSRMNAKIWSWFKQLILFKMSFIILRVEVLRVRIKHVKLINRKYPRLEIIFTTGFMLTVDFMLVIFLNYNEDVQIMMIGQLLTSFLVFSIFNLKHALKGFWQFKSILYTEIIFVAFFIYT